MKMSEINRQFKERIIGKRIVDISTEECHEGFNTDEESVGCDGGRTIIKLEDGTAIECWNSEWGGLRIKTRHTMD
jgi:hypothetical protein